MNYIGRYFRLSDVSGTGVSCSESGVVVADVPLLDRVSGSGAGQWRPRQISILNRELSARYGLPVEFNRKIEGLRAVTQALGRGDVVGAQIATLHLEIPDPPTLAKAARTPNDVLDLAHQLRRSGMLKADWDPAKHPRWPAGSPGGMGGEFAPTGTASDDAKAWEQSASGDAGVEPSPSIMPTQLTLPVPFDFPIPALPSEILPPPTIPDISPRDLPQNPYPDRPECEQEWAEATSFCLGLSSWERRLPRNGKKCIRMHHWSSLGGLRR